MLGENPVQEALVLRRLESNKRKKKGLLMRELLQNGAEIKTHLKMNYARADLLQNCMIEWRMDWSMQPTALARYHITAKGQDYLKTLSGNDNRE